MSLITMLICLGFIAGLIYLVNVTFAGLNKWIKVVFNCVLIGTAIFLVLVATGIWGEVRGIRVPHL